MVNSEHSYLTLAEASEGIYTEKGSKFIGIAFPVSTENDFKKELREIQSKHKGARHFCYAYSIGTGNETIHRSNDDGEPSGTAGRPILNQLISSQITNAGIVVVRYFGGVLLGASGLVRAYKQAAHEALKNNSVRVIEKSVNVQITCDYTTYIALMPVIKKHRGNIIQQVAGETMNLQMVIPQSELKQFENELISLKRNYKELKVLHTNS